MLSDVKPVTYPWEEKGGESMRGRAEEWNEGRRENI